MPPDRVCSSPLAKLRDRIRHRLTQSGRPKKCSPNITYESIARRWDFAQYGEDSRTPEAAPTPAHLRSSAFEMTYLHHLFRQDLVTVTMWHAGRWYAEETYTLLQIFHGEQLFSTSTWDLTTIYTRQKRRSLPRNGLPSLKIRQRLREWQYINQELHAIESSLATLLQIATLDVLSPETRNTLHHLSRNRGLILQGLRYLEERSDASQ